MILKTLHWYMLRELLRLFLLTAGALTTLLAFCGMFKPLTKQGLDVGQLMWLMMNLMPAMLAYAIPTAALFAAVLVYWRMSTDNEVTACRAGGISFWAILVPALLLGLVVASADLVFVNYVVPVFLQRTEAAGRRDLGTMLVTNAARQERFEIGKLVGYADYGRQRQVERSELEAGIESRTIVDLWGVAAMVPLGGEDRAAQFVVAGKAQVTIDQPAHSDEIVVRVSLKDAATFDPHTYRKLSGSIDQLPPRVIPVTFRDKPSFLNWIELQRLGDNPLSWGPVEDMVGGLERTWRCQQVAEHYREGFKPGEPVTFETGANERVVIAAPAVEFDAEKRLAWRNTPAALVRVETWRNGKPNLVYTCERAALKLVQDDVPGSVPVGSLEVSGNVVREDMQRGTAPMGGEKLVTIQPLTVPPAEVARIGEFPVEALQANPALFTPGMQAEAGNIRARILGLFHQIQSELHSRGSFALSCLTLVLLGAALGILMRGRNPLLVFVVGFVPAIILVLLIVAGRRMVENGSGNEAAGLWVIWTGNILMLVLVGGVYAKLGRG